MAKELGFLHGAHLGSAANWERQGGGWEPRLGLHEAGVAKGSSPQTLF